MSAVIRARYGSPGVLRLEDVERPGPRSDDVLVSTVNDGRAG
jgi:NADPH:quinone reductase-like Zn-dependent oxidoreductase